MVSADERQVSDRMMCEWITWSYPTILHCSWSLQRGSILSGFGVLVIVCDLTEYLRALQDAEIGSCHSHSTNASWLHKSGSYIIRSFFGVHYSTVSVRIYQDLPGSARDRRDRPGKIRDLTCLQRVTGLYSWSLLLQSFAFLLNVLLFTIIIWIYFWIIKYPIHFDSKARLDVKEQGERQRLIHSVKYIKYVKPSAIEKNNQWNRQTKNNCKIRAESRSFVYRCMLYVDVSSLRAKWYRLSVKVSEDATWALYDVD